MKGLLILRHAHAEGSHALLSDEQRPLSKRGQSEARQVANRLALIQPAPQIVLASSAARAGATAKAAHRKLPSADLQLLDALYCAGPEAWMEQIRALDDAVDMALLVGHNPGLEILVGSLTGATAGFRPATLAHVELPVESWSQVAADGSSRLVQVWCPDPTY